MRILSDCPAECRALLPAGTDWERLSPERLPEEERNLWRTVSEDNLLFAARVPAERPDGVSCLAIIESAPFSQFSALSRLLSQGVPLPSLAAVLALEGKGFRGQQDRSWIAVRGNIHLSIYARPSRRIVELGAGLTMLPTISVVDAVRSLARGVALKRIGVKWVNDVWMNGRKIAGVLSTTHVHGDVVEEVVIGIGLNVEVSPDVEPTPFVPAVGCVTEFLQSDLRWTDVAPVLLRCLADRYRSLLRDGPDDLLLRYREESLVLGRHVRIYPEGDPAENFPIASGIVTGLDENLTLKIAGRQQGVAGGRLVLDPGDESGD